MKKDDLTVAPEKLKGIILEEFEFLKEEDIVPRARFRDDLGLNFTKFYQLILAIEEEYDIDIPGDYIRLIRTIKGTMFCINRCLKKKEEREAWLRR